MYINNHKWVEAILFWDQKLELSKDIDVFYLIHEYDNSRGENITRHINFMTELDTDNPEERFSSSTRRKWRRLSAELEYSLYENNKHYTDLNFVVDQYNVFAKNAGLTLISLDFYKQISNDNKLTYTIAFVDGVAQYIHTFYISQGISRLLHTFPTSNCLNRDINIGLHRFDLVELKNKGIKKYDWGGAGLVNETNEKKLSIREYKRRFGGKEFIYFKSRIAGNEKGKKIIFEKYLSQ